MVAHCWGNWCEKKSGRDQRNPTNFYSNAVLQDGLGRVDGNSIIGLGYARCAMRLNAGMKSRKKEAYGVAMLDTQIVVFQVNFEVRQNEFLSDFFP